MNLNKKSLAIVVAVIAVLLIGGIVYSSRSNDDSTQHGGSRSLSGQQEGITDDTGNSQGTEDTVSGSVGANASGGSANSSSSNSSARRFYLNPASGNQTGQFTVELRLNSGGESVSALEARLNYDNSKLEFLGLDNSGSAFETTAPGNGGSNGSIKVVRGHQAGVSGDVLVTKLRFNKRAGASGSTQVSFNFGEALRAEGGNNVVTARDDATYNL